MKQGEIWIVAGGKDDAGKPRPVVILQDDRFDATASIIICAFTTDDSKRRCFACPCSRVSATACEPCAV